MSEFERKPDGGLSAWIETYEAISDDETDAELLCLLLELRRRRVNEPELKGELEAAERERDEYKHRCKVSDGACAIAEQQREHWMRRAKAAEAEIARRDAAASEPVYQLWSPGIDVWVECNKQRYDEWAHMIKGHG